jgi:hypothetical protein
MTTAQLPSSNGSSPDATPRPGGPPGWIAILAIGSLVLGALLIGLQLVGVNVLVPAPSPTIAPTGQAAQRTWDQAADALTANQFQVQEPRTDYRPGETTTLLNAPRKLLQVVLPSDPSGGYVVIYELPSNNEAQAAGEELLRLSTTGMAVVQYPRDTKFVLQRVGRTLVFFPWSAEANPDPRLPELAATLEGLGTPVTLP